MADPNPVRTAKLAGSMKKAFGELFDLFPMKPLSGDPNARKVPDVTRATMLGITGLWDGPANSKTPATRGAITDDVAHNWTLSFPSLTVYDADLLWTPQRGDKVVRKLDNTAFEVIALFPNGLGQTVIQLSNKARS